MSNYQPTEISDLQELDFSASGLYDDDLSEDAILVTPFEISTRTSGYLSSGGTNEDSVDPDSTCEEEGETYAYLIAHSRVRAALKRPLRLCKFSGAPACLMILEIEMFDSEHYRQIRRLLRFKAVDVSVELMDSGGLFKMTPEIVMFCPETFTGEPTVVKHTYAKTVGASIETSGGLPAGARVGIHRHHNIQFTEKCNVSILGRTLRDGDKTTIVKWQIEEDAALRQGVPKQLRFAIAVTYHIERAFSIKLNFTANLGFNDIEFRVKKKQPAMSVKVDPGMLREQALKDEHGPQHGQDWYCKADNSELTTMNLEAKTNLRGSSVGLRLILKKHQNGHKGGRNEAEKCEKYKQFLKYEYYFMKLHYNLEVFS